MSDPEILDPEGPDDAPAGAPRSPSSVEALATSLQRALPGRAVKVSVEERDAARSPVEAALRGLAGGPRFRIEAAGEGGPIVVESGPFGTLQVAFRAARFSFTGSDAASVNAEIAERVRELADEELVVFEEPAGGMLRVVVLRARDGRLEDAVDSGLQPHDQGAPDAAREPRLSSFRGTWSRAPTKQERKRIDKLTGGLMGKLKRKVLGKIVEKAAGSMAQAAEQVAGEVARRAAPDLPTGDDGGRKLGPKG